MSAQTAMPARTGKKFLQGLEDERQIWVGEERVHDVAAHPAPAGAARFVACPAGPVPEPHTLDAPERARRLVDRFVREEL
jgi:hypothetical protein